MTPTRLTRGTTAVLVIDMQAKLLPLMHNAAAVQTQVARLLAGAAVPGAVVPDLACPVLVTEQYPQGLGQTVPEIADLVKNAVFRQEKTLFSAFSPELAAALQKQGIHAVVVAGIEAHVCVLQTCLDLLDAGYTVAVATDAVGSRRKVDQDAALARLTQAGVIPTTVESALLELVRQAGTPEFKAMLPVIK